jgi:hypothetical protein
VERRAEGGEEEMNLAAASYLRQPTTAASRAALKCASTVRAGALVPRKCAHARLIAASRRADDKEERLERVAWLRMLRKDEVGNARDKVNVPRGTWGCSLVSSDAGLQGQVLAPSDTNTRT